MISDADIHVKETYGALGNVECHYSWHGGRFVIVTRDLLDEQPVEGKCQVGPYQLTIVQEDLWTGRLLCRRDDDVMAQLIAATYRVTWWLEVIYHRLIITAAIWGLAGYDPACVPSWRDLGRGKR